MHPVLFRVGEITVYAFGVLTLLSWGAAIAAAFWMARLIGARGTTAAMLAVGAVGAFFFGARAENVLVEWVASPDTASRLLFANQGWIYFAGLAVGIFGVLVAARAVRFPFAALADIVATAWVASSVLGRVGCFLAGCHFGKPTSLPWGVRFDPSVTGPWFRGQTLHPVQLYLVAAWLCALVVLGVVARIRRGTGEVALAGLAVIGFVGLTVELPFRAPPAEILFLWRATLWTIAFAGGALGYAVIRRRRLRQPTASSLADAAVRSANPA